MDSRKTTFPAFLKNPVCLAQFFLLGFLLMAVATVNAAQEIAEPLVVTYDSAQSSLDSVLRGEPGEAYLAYYSPEKGPERPALVVRITKGEGASASIAEVFDTPAGQSHVPIEFVEGFPKIPINLVPTITMTAIDGWWTHDGITNYNLDIRVNGRVSAIWGSDNTLWPQLLEPDDPNAQILVRDVNQDGLPDWDWRTMLPEFPGRGDIRTHYVERKCDSPVTIEQGVSPQWPFVAFRGGFEQETGKFRPPIVIDWETGHIRYFSEMVTARNQNCSYTLYSISRILPDLLNSPTFESPFGFYDLSGEGVGYPNLIIRPDRMIRNNPLLAVKLPEAQSIRYSWRNTVGDWRWDYKVDVLGQHQYDFETPIAGGATMIDAPSYDAFPDWVIGRKWPAVSFVAMEDSRNLSSEGIYGWSMRSVSDEFLFGARQEPSLSGFEDITEGTRGEYRLNTNHFPETYMSPIDNRLHLKWAEHGIWRLDNEQIIRLTNLNDDETIDVWSREAMAVALDMFGRPLEETVEGDDAVTEPKVLEVLYALDSHLLHAGSGNLTLVVSDYKPMLFETLPPTDHDTWETQRSLLAPYEDQRRDPVDLHGWLDAFAGLRSEIAGASLDNVRITADGFRFELALGPGYQVSGPDLLRLEGLAPGKYVVAKQDAEFMVEPLVPAQLSLDVRQAAVGSAAPPLQITIDNTGSADALDLTLIVETESNGGSIIELARTSVQALAGQTTHVPVDIPSTIAAGSTLRVRQEDSQGQVIATGEWTPLTGSPSSNPTASFGIQQAPILLPVVGVFAALIALAALLAITRQRGQPDL